MDRLFLDANILFSAAYRPDSRLLFFGRLKEVNLLTSAYALHEARFNLKNDAQYEQLEKLMKRVEVIEHVSDVPLPEDISLPEKDRPILQAAIASGSTHLITGDICHFGLLFGKTVENVKIMLPRDYLNARMPDRTRKR